MDLGGCIGDRTGAPPSAAHSPSSSGPCAAAVSRQLRAWGAAGEPRDQAATTTRHWPTRLIGTWVTESRGPAPVLLRVSPTRVTRLAWTEGCVARREERARPAAATAGGGSGGYCWNAFPATTPADVLHVKLLRLWLPQ